MTIRLDPAARRKVERLAAREGISLNEATNRLLLQAPDDAGRGARRRYRLRPRKQGFGFDVADSKRLLAGLAEDETRSKLTRKP